jgi:hypothetical protein
MAKKAGRKPTVARVQFQYVADPDYRVVPISGVHGHPNTHVGSGVFASFWFERMKPPVSFTRSVAADGTLGPEVDASDPETKNVERIVYTSFVLSTKSAREIGTWLLKMADNAEAFSEPPVKVAEPSES